MKKLLLSAVALMGFATVSMAQNASSTASQSTSLVLSNAISITFTGSGTNTGGAVTLPFSTVSDYANGVTSTAQQLEVQSNLPFDVTVNANSTNFTYTGSYTTGTTMTDAAQNLITNGTNGSNQLFSVQYQATPGFTYPAGTYTTDVVYTATQQ